jgi:NAD(P)-dependent dehydrogenase (short-subunit alcohol dehydrogenase family)
MAKKVWFITGSSRGFGRRWAEAALQRGDLVAATARDPSRLSGLVETCGDAVLPLQLDVTDQVAARDTVAQTHKTFGRLDVVVNNAGYGLAGELEEVSEKQARAQMETNFFGALWITQAVLPYIREQGSGHIVQVSSIGGICTYPGFSLYHASKWALEGMSESLAQEVAGFGIHVTLVWADSLPAYATVDEAFRNEMADTSNAGDPAATSKAILALVDAAAPPLRLFLGTGVLDRARATYAQRLKIWEQWEEVARAAQGK